MKNNRTLTDFEVALLSFLQDASNEFNSEKEIDYFIKKHSPKLLELAYKQKNMIEFKLTEEEEKAAREFMEEHRHPNVYKGAIGGHLEYLFTPTGVGDACCMHCTICGEKKNITDYSKW